MGTVPVRDAVSQGGIRCASRFQRVATNWLKTQACRLRTRALRWATHLH